MTEPLMSPYVRPDVQAMLAALKESPRPPMSDALIAQIRLVPPGTMPSPDLPVGELGTVCDAEMPGPHGPIRLRLYDPRAHREPGPVVVFYHGGGFVVGGIETHAGLCAELARGLDLPVVSVDYRLAPEHKWPAAPDDAETAARWIAANCPECRAAFEREFTGLVLCGDSAGGTLTVVTALALRDAPADVPLLMQWPIYPVIDSSRDYPSATMFGAEYGLGPEDMAYFGAAYAPDPLHHRHSALLADQAGMAPTFVVTAGLDPLRDQGRAYAAKLIEAGVDVSYREYAGTVHGFVTFRLALPSARDDLADMIAIARQMLDHALRTAPDRATDG